MRYGSQTNHPYTSSKPETYRHGVPTPWLVFICTACLALSMTALAVEAPTAGVTRSADWQKLDRQTRMTWRGFVPLTLQDMAAEKRPTEGDHWFTEGDIDQDGVADAAFLIYSSDAKTVKIIAALRQAKGTRLQEVLDIPGMFFAPDTLFTPVAPKEGVDSSTLCVVISSDGAVFVGEPASEPIWIFQWHEGRFSERDEEAVWEQDAPPEVVSAIDDVPASPLKETAPSAATEGVYPLFVEDIPMPYDTGIVTGDKVRLREKPSKDGEVLASLAKGTIVLIKKLGIPDGWTSVVLPEKNLEGFIAAQYVQQTTPVQGESYGQNGTFEALSASSQKFREADAALTAAYAAAKKKHPKALDLLKISQRAWLVMRDAWAKMENDSGIRGEAAYEAWMIKLTESRTAQLGIAGGFNGEDPPEEPGMTVEDVLKEEKERRVDDPAAVEIIHEALEAWRTFRDDQITYEVSLVPVVRARATAPLLRFRIEMEGLELISVG